ncbi:MAG: glycosyltransferase family 4 protein [Thermoproteota archaeon]|nr:glycosyltransferase family 4 protein [Thermoproteota archaeon]
MGSINIDVITPSVSPGGLYRVAIEEAKFLRRIGHDVRLISLIRPVNPWDELLQGISVEYLADFRGPTPFISEMLNRNLFLLKKITSDADIFICHNLPSCYSLMRSIKISNRSSRIIAYIHDPIEFTITGNIFQVLFRSISLKKMFAMRWLRFIDVIIVNSRRSQKKLAKELGLNSRVLYPALAPFSNKVTTSHREKFFLSVGRIGLHPTYKILLHILKRVPEMELVIAGSWSHTAKRIVEMFSSDSNINRRVKLIVNPTDEELARLYRSARAFLYPGTENFNMSALEAASHGCPILVSKESGICEIIGESVVMPAQNDLESFVKLVLELLKDERHAITEGLRIRDILNSYGSSYHMENLREMIEKLPGQPSRN